MKAKKLSNRPGRPRSFDTGKALECALQVFWRKGYEGASLSDLTKAMGINRPSLYAAFGDKQALFSKALDHYSDGPAAYFREALKAPTARAVAERLLQGTADMVTQPHLPHGCLWVQGASGCRGAENTIGQQVITRRRAGEAALRKRFNRAKSEGDLPVNCDPSALARYISTVIHGIAIQAADGATRRQLQEVIDTALRAWPK